ncbi:MAG: hypothetical protein IT162_22930 [Bryobacterales bacterium]|nr:hypothetical protein [Bryobacterales bacterium]
MEKRYGLDAISYLTDPPPPAGETSQWRRVPPKDRRKALLRAIGLKQRELAELNAQLASIHDDQTLEFTPAKSAPPGPLRRLLSRLLPDEG